MTVRLKKLRIWLSQKLTPMKMIALVFAGLIILGAVLLMLPAASRNNTSVGFLPAFFTATSATCVTGLVLFDTWSQWTPFGQVVIICLIEIGGLGFMSAASVVFFLLRRKVGLRQRLVMAQMMSLNEMSGVVHLQKLAILGSLAIQALGALILTAYFWPQYGFARAVTWGAFHAVSAFCNAGFDIFGSIEPGMSLIHFATDPVVLLTLGSLVIIGGLGFFVWEEIATKRRFSRFSVYTKLVLVITLVLLILGTVCYCALEWNNPETLGGLTVPQKLLGGFFQSVTVRTAGFAAIDQAQLTDGSVGVSLVLMLIGGSSGSTAGGVKTVTMVVLLLFLWNRARGRETVTVFHRTIPNSQVLQAMTLVSLMAVLAVFGGIFLTATSPISLSAGLYESVSALATVGLTAGATGKLSLAGKLLMIVYMYFGRVGILTISLGFLTGNRAQERFHYAHANLLIG